MKILSYRFIPFLFFAFKPFFLPILPSVIALSLYAISFHLRFELQFHTFLRAGGGAKYRVDFESIQGSYSTRTKPVVQGRRIGIGEKASLRRINYCLVQRLATASHYANPVAYLHSIT